MTLDVVAVEGQSAWWLWVIHDEAGAVVERSTLQFPSTAIAEAKGRVRMAQIAMGTAAESEPTGRRPAGAGQGRFQ